MEQEILKLKAETIKPEVKPSKMDKDTAENGDGAGSDTSKKKKGQNAVKLNILSYREVVIQDLKYEAFNTCYRLAQYQTPDGSYVSGRIFSI